MAELQVIARYTIASGKEQEVDELLAKLPRLDSRVIEEYDVRERPS